VPTSTSCTSARDTRPCAFTVMVKQPSRRSGDELIEYVRVAIHSRHEGRGVLLPASAVLRDDENLPYVYVEGAGGAYRRRRVETGGGENGRIEIRRGLRPGERVVAEGALFMQFAESQ